MSASKPTFNLTALADQLSLERRMMPLADMIRRARELHSLTADIEMALESLDTLSALLDAPRDHSNIALSITESALLNNALILYVRATKSTSDERRGFDLRSRFSEQEMRVHEEMCDLRDKAIAHFGSGGTYVGEWKNEIVVLQVTEDGTKPGVITRRKLIDKKLMVRVRAQCTIVRTHFRNLSLAKLEQITGEINKALVEDVEFHNAIKRHPLNLDVFLTSPQAGEMARSSISDGYSKGIVRHE